MAGHAVHVAVGRHDAGHPRLADRRLEREELLVAHLARTQVRGRLVEPPLREPVTDHVLGGGDHALGQSLALDSADVGATELGGQVGILTVGLLDAAPARIAGYVQDGRERLSRARREHAATEGRSHPLDQTGVPGRGGTDRLLEARRVT